jgi:hypothetical protein
MKASVQRSPGIRSAALAASFALALALFAPAATNADDAPMRTEDVVRLLVQGSSTEEILSAIRSRPAVFDVSPDMQEELRVAGVSDEIIQAMIERMEELNPPPSPVEEPAAEADAPAPPEPTLRIRLHPGRGDALPAVLRLEGTVDSQLREAWQLDAAAEGTPFEDLAVYLVCRTATHVPDHWRSKSPLGRDFISMPRHRMLVFLTASEQAGESPGSGALELKLPGSLDVDLLPGEEHDLSLGIAIQAGGRYLRWTDDTWDELTVDADGSRIHAALSSGSGGRIHGLQVRFDRNPPDADEE